MTENVRYWSRVGMYVTEDFAEEWIKRIADEDNSGDTKFLEGEIEEFVNNVAPSASTLRAEIKELFEGDFVECEMSPDTRAIILAQEMEANKVARIKQLKEEGMTLDEAKEAYQKEIDLVITDTLGLEPGALAIKMGGESGIPEGEFGEDALTDDSEDASDDRQEA